MRSEAGQIGAELEAYDIVFLLNRVESGETRAYQSALPKPAPREPNAPTILGHDSGIPASTMNSALRGCSIILLGWIGVVVGALALLPYLPVAMVVPLVAFGSYLYGLASCDSWAIRHLVSS